VLIVREVMEVVSQLMMLGIILIVIGSFLIMLDIILRSTKALTPEGEVKREIRGGGVIVIGPLPIIFGSDRKTALIMGVLGAIIMLILIITYLYLWKVI